MLEFGNKLSSQSIKQGTEAEFAKDVLEASRNLPVLAYFSASWCGPCKTFGPELEKAIQKTKGAVALVKYDIDNCQQIASQLGIQSVPTVFGFVNGQPVDGFAGAQPASQVKTFLDKLIKMVGGGNGIEAEIEEAENLLASGAAVDAAQKFATILSEDQENAAALGGMARAYLALGNLDSAEAILNSVTDEMVVTQEVIAAKAAIDLAKQAADVGPIAELRHKLNGNPDDHETRLALATALHASGKNEDAVNELLELYRRDREWGDGAAQKQLLKIFEAIKANDPVALKGRRKLASMHFA